MGSHNDNAMDQRLLMPSKSQSHGGGDGDGGDDSVASSEFMWSVFVEEVKRLGYIAGPMVEINQSQYLLQVISLKMVGHLGELQLSSTAIAVSLSSVTGFSVILGMSSALETLCWQAYGAGQYRIVGTLTYTAIFCLLLVCIPLSILWIYIDKILIFRWPRSDHIA